MKKVVVIAGFHPAGMNMLMARNDIETVVVDNPTQENIKKAIVNADAVTIRTAPLTSDLLSLAPNLKIVSRYGVGTDNIDVEYCSSKNIPVAVTAGGNDRSVAEHAFMFIMNLSKDMKGGELAVLKKDWLYREARVMHDLYDKNVLLIGFGRIGQRLAHLCLAFDMKVLAYDPYVTSSPVEGVTMVSDFRDALPVADFISLHLPFNKQTKDIIGKEELHQCKAGAFLINTARGGLISEENIMYALDNELLAGVGLDVFTQEPPEPSLPLFKHPRSFFTLHTAGMSEECTKNLSEMTVQRIFDCFDGQLEDKYVFNRKDIKKG